MEYHRATLATCPQARGAVVVIDVLRAFTTAAYALAAGAQEIVLVGTVTEAFELRRGWPGALITGEVDGLKVAGFDFGNSPAEIAVADLAGRRLIQRTGHGTQGAIRSAHAGTLLAAGFANASATVAALLRNPAEEVTFVVTGALPDERFSGGEAGGSLRQGDEDAACADYLEACLRVQRSPASSSQKRLPDPGQYLERVRRAPAANKFLDPEQADFSEVDLDYCTRLDIFDFAMQIRKKDGLLTLTAIMS